MKGINKKIFALICAISLMVTSIIGVMPTKVAVADTVADIILDAAIQDYGTISGYKYLGYTYLKGATSEYKYMIITFKGDITNFRMSGADLREGYEDTGITYWMNQSQTTHINLVGSNPVFSSETETTLVIDIEATGFNLDAYAGMHMHYNDGSLNITDCRLTTTLPEEETTTEEPTEAPTEEETTTEAPVVEDIVITNAITSYKKYNDNGTIGYSTNSTTISGATSAHKYLVISYVGDISRCRVTFSSNGTSQGTKYLDASQSSSDAVLVNHNGVFTSETGAILIMDVEASGFTAEGCDKIQVSSNGRALKITDCRLTATLPEMPAEDVVLSSLMAVYGEEGSTGYKSKNQTVSGLTSDYKYLVISYVGSLKKCRVTLYSNDSASTSQGTKYIDPSASSSRATLINHNNVFESQTGATVIVDLAASGYTIENVGKVALSTQNYELEITDMRFTSELPLNDIVLEKAIATYGTEDSTSYTYKDPYVTNVTSDYKYLMISYVGSISRCRVTFYDDSRTSIGAKWFDPSKNSNIATLVNHNGVFESETGAILIMDIEASGFDMADVGSFRVSSDGKVLEITDIRLTTTVPQGPVEDIVLPKTFGVYGTGNDSAYASKTESFTGATSSHKYLSISYVGDVSRCRIGFYNSTGQIGTEMWVDPGQSSSDLVLAGNNYVFKSETETTVVVDIESSGFNPEELTKIVVHSNNRALEITDCRLTSTLPDGIYKDITLLKAIYDFGEVESTAEHYVSLVDAPSVYKYLILTYMGDISKLGIQRIYDGETKGDFYWMDQSQTTHLSLVGENLILSSDTVARVVVDLEASGINLDEWDFMKMQYGPGSLEIGNARLSQSPEITSEDIFRYFRTKEEVTDYSYSFAVVGDTQIVTNKDKNNGTNNLDKLYDWIVNNKTDKNIQYVFGLGDVVETISTTEFEIAQTAISKLDGQVPYTLIRGNHDIPGCVFATDVTDDYFTQYLGTEAYKGQFANGGFYEEDNIFNAWNTFSVGNIDYLILALDYCPSDEVLAWASNIVEAHPNHNVIVTTHAYMDENAEKLTISPNNYVVNDGVKLWDKFVSQHENIVLLLCGHIDNDEIVVTEEVGVNGNTVTSMLINPQGVDKAEGSTGMVAMLYFSEDGKNVQVECYSTVREKFFLEANQFSMELPVIERAVEENTVTIDGIEVDVIDGQVTLGDAELGYYCTTNNKMYSANATVTVEGDMSFVTTDMSITATAGAGIRLSDPTGIRFQMKLSTENLPIDALQNAEVISEGTIITTNDYYESNGALTLESDYAKVVIENSGWHNGVEGVYCGSLINIKESNYVREFIAVGYLTIKYEDGQEKTIYSNMTNARSVQWVAQAIIDTGRLPNYTEAQQALINSFVSVSE